LSLFIEFADLKCSWL